MDTIKYEDFAKLDMRVGTVAEARVHEKADKLMILQVRVGDELRQIVSGIRKHYGSEELLVGKRVIVVMNLEPRELRGEMSHGMLLAASDADGNLSLLMPDGPIIHGSSVK